LIILPLYALPIYVSAHPSGRESRKFQMLRAVYGPGSVLERARWLKAGVVFVVSLSTATALGLAFSALTPPPTCGFAILMDRERVDAGLKATLVSVDGSYRIEEVAYKVVLMDDGSSTVVMEGDLSAALEGAGEVTYYPVDTAVTLLEEGDYLIVEVEGEAEILLLTRGGAPLGWTGGCEA
jgi:hypothetical protein